MIVKEKEKIIRIPHISNESKSYLEVEFDYHLN